MLGLYQLSNKSVMWAEGVEEKMPFQILHSNIRCFKNLARTEATLPNANLISNAAFINIQAFPASFPLSSLSRVGRIIKNLVSTSQD